MAKILVISPTPSHPQDAGNRARIFALLSGLKAEGHKVYFALVKMESGDEAAMAMAWDAYYPISYRPPLRLLAKKAYARWPKMLGGTQTSYNIDDWYSSGITREIQLLKNKILPDVVLVEYVFLSKAFACFDEDTLKVLDTHDVFGDRHLLYREHKMAPQWFFTTVAEEKKALDRADLIIAIQREERAYFSRLTKRKVLSVGHLCQPSMHEVMEPVIPGRLLFVGSSNPINVAALKWFLAEVFPEVRRQFPHVTLEVIGACVEGVAAGDNLILTGRVEDLGPHYERAEVVINPVAFGTGLKIKTIEALAYGRPLVSTTAGAAGLEVWAGKAYLVADTPEEFLAAIGKVVTSEKHRLKLRSHALDFSKNTNKATLKPLTDVIAGLSSR